MANDTNRWADYNGLEMFWDRIRRRYDKKLDAVVAKDDSVKVTDNNRIQVKISRAEGNALQLKTEDGEKGLFVPAPAKQHKLTFGADQEYVYDGSEDVTVPVYKGDYNE